MKSTRSKIFLATCRAVPDLSTDDRALRERIRDRGFDVQPLIWDDRNPAFHDTAAVVVRSCWDYHLKHQDFLRWAASLEKKGVTICNSPALMHWNHDKRYLLELHSAGIQIPPTLWLECGSNAQLGSIMSQAGWSDIVVKPSVSAASWRTFRVRFDQAAAFQSEFEKLLMQGRTMVQKFIPEVQTRGEWSFIFFDRKFSHAVLKRAAADEFRVQDQFGGSVDWQATPTRNLISQAKAALDSVKGEPLYARVDGVELGGGLCLMELELIEPALFLKRTNRAIERFAEAICAAVESAKSGNRIRGEMESPTIHPICARYSGLQAGEG
jgi:glutathione synthase/RimK-type ligase-like ATP-grasp enzyme